jgi:hypothetical protein
VADSRVWGRMDLEEIMVMVVVMEARAHDTFGAFGALRVPASGDVVV